MGYKRNLCWWRMDVFYDLVAIDLCNEEIYNQWNVFWKGQVEHGMFLNEGINVKYMLVDFFHNIKLGY
jgi:hypothetical protein